MKRFKLPLSREGLLWFIVSFAMLVTGLFKGINLITLLACWMVTLVFVNYLLAFPQLRRVTAQRFFPESAFADTPFSFLLQVDNSATKPATGISIHDSGPDHRTARFISKLAAKSCVTLAVTLEISRRGHYHFGNLALTTGYPWALVQLRKSLQEPADLVIFPKLGSLRRGRLRRYLAQHSPTLGQARTFPRRHPGAQMEFHGLRTFRAGDSPRWIHWRTTARRGELMIREFEDLPNDHLVLVVDPCQNSTPMLERVLSMAATICWEWCRQKENRLALAVAGATPVVLIGNTGLELAKSMLECLALTKPCSHRHDDALLSALNEVTLPPGPILVLSPANSALPGLLSQVLHRSVAHLNLGFGEEKDFFEL
jgi:uncharacterized protein (DUF58 family)